MEQLLQFLEKEEPVYYSHNKGEYYCVECSASAQGHESLVRVAHDNECSWLRAKKELEDIIITIEALESKISHLSASIIEVARLHEAMTSSGYEKPYIERFNNAMIRLESLANEDKNRFILTRREVHWLVGKLGWDWPVKLPEEEIDSLSNRMQNWIDPDNEPADWGNQDYRNK